MGRIVYPQLNIKNELIENVNRGFALDITGTQKAPDGDAISIVLDWDYEIGDYASGFSIGSQATILLSENVSSFDELTPSTTGWRKALVGDIVGAIALESGLIGELKTAELVQYRKILSASIDITGQANKRLKVNSLATGFDFVSTHCSIYTITNDTTAGNSELTILDGTLTNAGTSTVSGDATPITIPLVANFNENDCKIFLNGLLQNKGVDVSFVSAGVINIVPQLFVGNIIEIYREY